MAEKFDPAVIEAEENLLIDYQFLLQEVMTRKGLTMAQLAEKAGLTKARISQIMGPESNPTVKTFARLFHALGERVAPKIQSKGASLESKLSSKVPDWAPFEQSEKLDFVTRAADRDIIALVKDARKLADASNDNEASVVVMHADVMMALEAA